MILFFASTWVLILKIIIQNRFPTIMFGIYNRYLRSDEVSMKMV